MFRLHRRVEPAQQERSVGSLTMLWMLERSSAARTRRRFSSFAPFSPKMSFATSTQILSNAVSLPFVGMGRFKSSAIALMALAAGALLDVGSVDCGIAKRSG